MTATPMPTAVEMGASAMPGPTTSMPACFAPNRLEGRHDADHRAKEADKRRRRTDCAQHPQGPHAQGNALSLAIDRGPQHLGRATAHALEAHQHDVGKRRLAALTRRARLANAPRYRHA